MSNAYKPDITPEKIQDLAPDEVFVFGSNKEGHHAGGAARQALKWGAIMGQGEGLQGETYAIPTMFETAQEIKPYVDRFITFAKENPDKQFLVTQIGCGIAGFTPDDIAPLFKQVLDDEVENISLPQSFINFLIPHIEPPRFSR